LLVTGCPHVARLARFYENVTRLPAVTANSGPTSARSYYAFKLENRRRPLEPLGPCTGAAAN
ncbi:MAG: glycosyltransferase family 39 protein, partial [Xanthobacteraceae bacterium]